MDSKTDSIQVWSTMVNHPLCYYDPHYDAHMCAWSGVIMTRTFAMLIVSANWMNMFPNDSQKSAAEREFHRLVALGALNWPDDAPTYYHVMNKLTHSLNNNPQSGFNQAKERLGAKKAMAWFLPQAEKTLDRAAF